MQRVSLLFLLAGVAASTMIGMAPKPKVVIVTDRLLDAIWFAESSRRLNPPDGDDGKAIGPMQIWPAYFSDAKAYKPKEITFDYQDIRGDLEKSKIVVRAYMSRYAPDKATDEQIARIHNGGPTGHKKAATAAYWEKVKQELNK